MLNVGMYVLAENSQWVDRVLGGESVTGPLHYDIAASPVYRIMAIDGSRKRYTFLASPVEKTVD